MGAKKKLVFSTIIVESLVLTGIRALTGAIATGFLISVFQDMIVSPLGIPFL
jgi:hypothetical protein